MTNIVKRCKMEVPNMWFLLLLLLGWLTYVNGGTTTNSKYNVCTKSPLPGGCKCDFVGLDISVNCMNRSLTSVPADIPFDAIILILSGNPLTNLRAIDFVGFIQLYNLTIDGTSIREIEVGTFDSIPTLKYLYLREASLTRIDNTMFVHLPNLAIIDVSFNDITYIQRDAFYSLHNLRSISLTGNPLNCDCEMGGFKEWTDLRKSETNVLGAECKNKNYTTLFDVTDFGFCSGIQLFTKNLQCIQCGTTTSPKNCHQQNLVTTCAGQKAVCYSLVDYKNDKLWVTKGCTDDSTCHNWEKGNSRNCFLATGDRECKFCCLGERCNVNNLANRIRVINFNAQMRLSGNITSGLADSSTSEYINFVNNVKNELKNLITNGRGAEGSFDVKIKSLGPTDLTIYFSVSCSTVREIKKNNVLQYVNTTLHTASTLRGYPVDINSINVTENVQINSTGICLESKTTDSKGVFNWPLTYVGSKASAYCVSSSSSQPIVIYRQCVSVSGIATWLAPDTDQCRTQPSTTTATIATTTTPLTNLLDLDKQIVTESNADIYSNDLRMLSTGAESFNARDVNITISSLEKLLNLSGTFEADQREQNIVQTMSNLLDSSVTSLKSAQDEYQAGSRFLGVIDKLTNSTSLSDGKFENVEKNLGLFAVQSDGGKFNGMTLSTTSEPGTALDSSKLQLTNTPVVPDKSTSWIKLPSDLISQLPSSDQDKVSRVTFAAFKNDNLFKAIGSNLDSKGSSSVYVTGINSMILSANVPGVVVKGLQNPIEFQFKQEQNGTNATCVYFVEEGSSAGQWDDDGCQVQNDVPGNYTTCECDHLTNFALLMDIYQIGGGIDDTNKQALTYLSYIGCAVSLLGLLLTLLTYTMFRKLRNNNPSKILINICIAIAATNLVFLVGEQNYALQNEVACKVVAGLLHYFLLATMMWMLVEAFYMYKALIQVFDAHFSRFLLKTCLFGWGIPLVIVGITIGVNTTDNYGNQAGGICWLAPIPFYASFLAPIGITIIINFVVFAMVLKRILGVQAKKITKSDKTKTSKRLRGAVTVVVMLGLTWAFAIFAVTSEAGGLIFQYLFTVSNSLQGFFIFLFHCLLKVDARKSWRMKILGTDSEMSQTSKDFKSATALHNRKKQTGYSSSSTKEKTGEFTDISKSISEDGGGGISTVQTTYEKTKVKAYPSYSTSSS